MRDFLNQTLKYGLIKIPDVQGEGQGSLGAINFGNINFTEHVRGDVGKVFIPANLDHFRVFPHFFAKLGALLNRTPLAVFFQKLIKKLIGLRGKRLVQSQLPQPDEHGLQFLPALSPTRGNKAALDAQILKLRGKAGVIQQCREMLDNLFAAVCGGSNCF